MQSDTFFQRAIIGSSFIGSTGQPDIRPSVRLRRSRRERSTRTLRALWTWREDSSPRTVRQIWSAP